MTSSAAWRSSGSGAAMAKKLAYDKLLFSTVIVLTAFGLIMVYSASAVQDRGGAVNRFLVKQSLAAALGLVAMWVAMHVDLNRLRRPAVIYAGMLGIFALLLATLLGPEWNDVNRWLFIGGVSIQPSELAKLAVAIFIAYQIQRQTEREGESALLLPCGVVLATIVGLILLQPDLGTAALICAIALLMLFLSGVRKRFFVSGAMALVPLLASVILAVDYQRQRLVAFLDPGLEPMGMNWQANQSLIAVGSGGVNGVGLAQGVQKLHFLPQPHSDFIYAVIAEELGFLGAVAVLAVFALFVWRGAVAGAGAKETFNRYLAWGLTGMVALQASLHVGVVLKLLPTKGIPLPFISYGGSSLVVCLIAAGLILNVSQHG